MILYIHGFGSSGEGGKARQFRTYFKSINVPFIAPSLSYVPELAIQTLEEIIQLSSEPVTVIGSSLGGYYSLYLAEKYNLKAVLINPAVNAPRTLETFEEGTNYYDSSSFEWNSSHISMLENYAVKEFHNKAFLFLQKGDDVLDYREALEKLPEAATILEEGGNHSFDQIERHFDTILKFILK